MKKAKFLIPLLIVFISVVLPGCQAIGDVFKAGVWSGIIIVVLIIALILYFVTRGRK